MARTLFLHRSLPTKKDGFILLPALRALSTSPPPSLAPDLGASDIPANTMKPRHRSPPIEERFVPRHYRDCAAREWNFSHEKWIAHRSPWRHLRHMVQTPNSAVLQRLAFPDLLLVGSTAGALTVWNSTVATASAVVHLGPLPFTVCTVALGMLVTFRTNASYNRFVEARNLWGEIINSSRDLLRQSIMWMPGEEQEDKDNRQRLRDLIVAYPILLRYHLTRNGGHHGSRSSRRSSRTCIEGAESRAATPQT